MFVMKNTRKRIAIVGAGTAGCTCASILADSHEVEIFESSAKNEPSRPLQMEGALHYLDNIPNLRPSYEISKLILSSENESSTFEGSLGYLYKIGGTEGVEVILRKAVERRVKINYSTKIKNLDMLSDWDIIIAADGFRSKIALMAGMRKKRPEVTGLGLGFTVKGDFTPGKTFSLFDNRYAPGGYLYLIPINRKTASLVSASIGTDFKPRILRDRLRSYAERIGLEIIDEWTDMEKWYEFHSYQRGNIYVIGGAASFTDRTFGFGLKYSMESAKLGAEAIMKEKSYHDLLVNLLKELDYWERIGNVFVNTTNKEKDLFIRLASNPFVKKRIEKGKSIRPYFSLLTRYLRLRKGIPLGSYSSKNPTPYPYY
ncbi:MAG: NAD(P)/FAD-dependent oxidoreductase [Methanomassiliicoccales archaeon]|nr:MAG: NAD(P)/FAD-dependent oxidoreductase [Methanomassiliicoccales archaeon]